MRTTSPRSETPASASSALFTRVLLGAVVCGLSGVGAFACDEPPKPEPLKNAALTVDPAPEPAKPPQKAKTAPEFEVDESSVKVGYSRYLVDRPDGLTKLRAELQAQKEYIDGKELSLSIARKAKLPWVTTYLSELQTLGASGFTVHTPTRSDYPKQVMFTASTKAGALPPCTPVAMIAEDRTTATWKAGGGSQTKRGRGLGGPDLSTTGLSLSRLAKSCSKGDAVVVGAHESVEWGLVYDLAASTTQIEDATFARRFLMLQEPKVGKPVELR